MLGYVRRIWPFTPVLAALAAALAALAIVAPPTGTAFAQYAPKAALQHGQALYTGSCASCHGLHGEGAGMPGLGIPRLDAGGTAWQLADLDLRLIIRDGKGAMPGIGTIWTREDLGTVLTLLRSWWTPEQQRAHDAGPQTPAP